MFTPQLYCTIPRQCYRQLAAHLRLLQGSVTLLRRFSSAFEPTLKKLPFSEKPFEEEGYRHYKPERYYRAAPGELVHDGRYSIISKLGWGGNSTVWLAEDLNQPTAARYVTVSFGRCASDENRETQEAMLQRIVDGDPEHRGRGLVRQPIDDFEVTTGHGKHYCVVYEPLRMTLAEYQKSWPDNQLPLSLVKVFACMMLHGLDYLHSCCKLIHTDLKHENVLMTFESDEVLLAAVKRLKVSTHAYKETPNGPIFETQNNIAPLDTQVLFPIIADLEGVGEIDHHAHPIQIPPYRAPEVLLGWGWTEKADIWNFGQVVWKMVSGSYMFRSLYDKDHKYNATCHLAQMIAVLGPPDPELIKDKTNGYHYWTPAVQNARGELCQDALSFFGGPFLNAHSGELLSDDFDVERQPLEHLLGCEQGEGREELVAFASFLYRMLTWDPDKRASAEELLDHPWLAEVHRGDA